jgi:hypothetical protein
VHILQRNHGAQPPWQRPQIARGGGTVGSADVPQSTASLYGVQLYGNDAPHIRYAATRYATEARKVLESLLPSTEHIISTKSGTNNNVGKVEETLAYAAESRRLLATAQTLEAATAALHVGTERPSSRYLHA